MLRRIGDSRRARFWWAALVEGSPTLGKAASVVLTVLGGSGLAAFFFFVHLPGAWALVLVLSIVLAVYAEGSFRLWDRAEAETPEGAPAADVGALVAEGETLRARIDTDAHWDAPACEAAVAQWREKVERVLRERWAHYVRLFQNIEPLADSSASITHMFPSDVERRRIFSGQIGNHLSRLRDIGRRIELSEGGPGGHDLGRRAVRWLRFKDELLLALPAARDLHDRVHALAMQQHQGHAPPTGAEEASVNEWLERLRHLVDAGLGHDQVTRLLSAADPPSEDADAIGAMQMKLSRGEEAIFALQDPEDRDLLPSFDPDDPQWKNYF